ncbi:MAG TPA: lyase family protein [Gaiellales bacterium]|nr:lyase family protein [Gaiellales bacterium]
MSGFAAILVPDDLLDAVSDRAWLGALVEAERALASAEAATGAIPADAAAAIADRCRPELFDAARLAEAGRSAGNPVEPLVRELADAVGGEASAFVHWGATSQDIMDSAAMLVARRALGIALVRLDEAAGRCAELAAEHRSTPMAARTLLMQAVPTTFGLKCAGWLVALLDARAALERIRHERLAAQLGGAAGTLAALGETGPEVVRRFAGELDLPEPDIPWHADRLRIAELGSALAAAAGAAAKIAGDLVLLSQTEVAEVREAAGGASSTMPQKQNPAASVRAIACARQARGHATVLLAAVEAEHERAAGAWQSEWAALSGALACGGGALANTAEALAGLEIDPERMRQNLDLTGGVVVAERVSHLLAPRLGRSAAREVVATAAATGSFRWALVADERVGLSAEEVDALLDPEEYLGSAAALVDRALARHAQANGGDP